ncbi:MAG: hypothetical protein JXB32_01205 [Deltaproteobacteria bacterium]|nr:hypothetical protein [Deltaproteobacteria bacterium]
MPRNVTLPASLVLVALLAAAPAAAEPAALAVADAPSGGLGPWGLLLSVNYDDDDENRRLDNRQSPPAEADDDLRRVLPALPAGTASVTLEADGAERIRVHAGGRPVALPGTLEAAAAAELLLDGVAASTDAADVVLRARFLDADGAELGRAELPITVIGVALLDAANAILDPTRASAQISNEVTNNDSLPRDNEWDAASPDPDNLRIEAWLAPLDGAAVVLRATSPAGDVVRAELELDLAGPDGRAARSPFVRLVADTMDWTAPGVVRQTLRASLRDRVSAVVRARDGQEVGTDLRVGRPGNEDGPQAVRRARWNMHFLRLVAGGPVALGVDEETARKIGRDQVAASNEVYAACNITFGDPAETPIALDDPPGPTLLAVSDVEALHSSGGEIRFRVDGVPVGPIVVGSNWPPYQTAGAIAQAVEAAGFVPEASENAQVDHGAGRSADVLIRDREGRPVTITADGEHPLTTDRRQSLAIGAVDLTDRLTEFNNATSAAGTLEERTMYKVLADDEPGTIDLFVVNRFAGGGRQGEAFIEHDRGMVRNALVLDRTGIRQTRQAWTQSHEAGHVLLDDPYHPDNFGPDRPWMLMDADASLGAVDGPKRVTEEECDRIRRESGIRASPPLLWRWDERSPDGLLEPEDLAIDLGYPRP